MSKKEFKVKVHDDGKSSVEAHIDKPEKFLYAIGRTNAEAITSLKKQVEDLIHKLENIDYDDITLIDWKGDIVYKKSLHNKIRESLACYDSFGKYDAFAKVGFTEAKLRKNSLIITHRGNMGNDISSVNENLTILDLPSIESLKENFEVLYEDGFPDYLYKIEIKLPAYDT